MHEPIQFRRAESAFFTKFVAKQSGGFVHVVSEPRVFRGGLGDVMVDDDPLRLVEPRFEREVRDPRGFFTQLALFPLVVVVGLKRNVRAEKFFSEPLKQHAGDKTVEVAFVCDDDFRFREIRHGGERLIQPKGHGERGFCDEAKNLFENRRISRHHAHSIWWEEWHARLGVAYGEARVAVPEI